MAVYTSVDQFEIKKFLSQYNLGKLISYKGIIEGIENTNFKIKTEKGIYILTIFEKRVDENDLPFFINLQKFLSNRGFPCPIPIQNNNQVYINSILNKKSIISSFLNGRQIEKPMPEHCYEVGKICGPGGCWSGRWPENGNYSVWGSPRRAVARWEDSSV